MRAGTRGRRWRRERAVSPIVATILLVAITVVLAAVLYVLISGVGRAPGGATLGSAFSAGVASPPLIESAAGTTGCAANHFCYVLTIAQAARGLTAATMVFAVQVTGGTTYIAAAAGGFTIYNTVTQTIICSSAVAAGHPLSTVAWVAGGGGNTPATQLTSAMTIIIDLGAVASPSGTGLNFESIGVGQYSGTVSVSLP